MPLMTKRDAGLESGLAIIDVLRGTWGGILRKIIEKIKTQLIDEFSYANFPLLTVGLKFFMG